MEQHQDVTDLLRTREATHGPFSSNAVAFDRLLAACPLEGFDPRARYAVAGIYFKLARLYSGKLCREHVEDIEGYAAKLRELIDSTPSNLLETIRSAEPVDLRANPVEVKWGVK